MTDSIKLSSTLEAGLRLLDRNERGQTTAVPAKRTLDALIARGLLEKTGRWISISRTGHEWLAREGDASTGEHRCQWDMSDDVQPDSEQCTDTALDGGLLCQTHQDLHDDLMDQMREQDGAYQS